MTNLNDAGSGSLRDAIASTPTGGTVDFQPGLTGTEGPRVGEKAPSAGMMLEPSPAGIVQPASVWDASSIVDDGPQQDRQRHAADLLFAQWQRMPLRLAEHALMMNRNGLSSSKPHLVI